MEPVTIHLKTTGQDGYGDTVENGYNETAAMTLAALVAPNHDPLRIAVGRKSEPVKFDIYVPGGSRNGIDPALHVAMVRGVVYEVDGKSAEWDFMSSNHAGDHFTVTASIN